MLLFSDPVPWCIRMAPKVGLFTSGKRRRGTNVGLIEAAKNATMSSYIDLEKFANTFDATVCTPKPKYLMMIIRV